MAITKIMYMKAGKAGNVAAHLKHSLEYICNEAKTENRILVGGINCLPDYAYEQMIGTKEMFGQVGGRQGYHFIISLKPGEGTTEQMYDIVQRFAEEFLGGEYEAVFAVHTDKDHLHSHLVFNSVNMINGRKYDYRKGDWKDIIQPITNRLCEEYGLSIVAAEYSKDPVNMNRKQWEKEQSWKDFITGDMLYCRNKAESFEEFVFLMEKLGYEVKVGAHISVKADGMRRSRRLDTLDEEFSLQNLQEYYEQPHPYKYVALPVYQPGYALIKKPKNAFQQRYYGKLYRMCVVQKYRFQYKYTRYQQDLIRMKELQEEYLFLNRTGINGWNDVFDVKRVAERKIADIDAKKKELYNEHARQKYQYEKGGDVTVYLYHEAHYREQLAELKEKRKEAKSELGTINRCLSESTYAHLEIPDDVDIENLYVVDVPEFESETISYPEYEAYEEKTVETESTVYGPAERTEPFVEPTVSLVSETITEPVSETVPLSEAFSEDTEGFAERVAEEVVEETYHPVNEPEMTNDMTSEQRMKLADELIAMKIFMISLSGGDPLLCNDLERLVEKFTDAGISTMICSPGLLIDEMQIERLCRNSLVAFNISLDSVNSKINDYQRGREGACDSAKRLISYIDKYGLGKIFTSVEMVITKKNKKEIEPLVQEMINHNVNEIRIQPVVAMNYMTYDKGLALNFEDIDEIQKEIERVTKKYAINNAKEGMLCVRFVDQSKAVIKGMKDKINWGGIISPEGDLMLNGYIPYIYGNLFEYADFQDAWQKGFAKGWEIIQKDETLQNVKNIIDLQKLFKEKGFVKKRYE